MHDTSQRTMRALVEKFFTPHPGMLVIDVGSKEAHRDQGTYRPIFEPLGVTYQGLDLEPGANVDIVLSNPYKFPLIDRVADAVISGQAFEHIEFFWLTWQEMVRILKPGGLIFLIAPSRGHVHPYPVDCWRFYADSFRALAKYGGLEVLQVQTNPQGEWGDTAGAFRKPLEVAKP